ncbi:MAG: DUF1905 domain-containing protein [Crocinitomicaceae bacterium]|nr:DUF1905 domain-containing protein [Crocinitomicaceae bacterium]
MDYEFKGSVGFIEDDTLMWNYRIMVPDAIADQFRDTDKRIICTINDSEVLHCALMPHGDGRFYIMTNNAFRKKYGIHKGDEVLVKLKKDTSKYGMYVPDFFEELCYQDPEGSEYFHQLTKGKQRSLLHIITKVKSEHKQLEKALVIFDFLKNMHGELDYKALNEAFKNNRFKN